MKKLNDRGESMREENSFIRVLLVDDDNEFTEIAKKYLEEEKGENFKIETINDPKNVVKLVKEKKFDIIISDYQMPKIRGLDLLKKLNEEQINIPFILLSSERSENVALEALNLGAAKYIKKEANSKVVFNELLSAINETVRIDRLKKELIESEEKYRTVIENYDGIIFKGNFDFTPIVFQGKVKEISGYEPEEFLENRKKWIDLVYTKDKEKVLSIGKKIEEERDFKHKSIYRIITKQGKRKWVQQNLYNICDEMGKPEAVQGTIVELSKKGKEKINLTKLINYLPGTVYKCLFDKDWTMLYISKKIEELTGYKRVDLIKNAKISYGQLIDPRDREYVWTEITKAIEKKERFTLKYRIQTANGDIKWVWEKGIALYCKKCKKPHLEGYIHDITELVQTENELKTLLETSPDIVARISKEGKVLFINEAIKKEFNQDPSEMIGETIESLSISDEAKEDIKNNVLKALTKNIVLKWDFEEKGKDAVSTYNIQLVPEIIGRYEENTIFMIIRNITESKRMEKELEQKNFELYVLNKIINIGNTSVDENELAEKVVLELVNLLEFDAGLYYSMDEKNNPLLIFEQNLHELLEPNEIRAVNRMIFSSYKRGETVPKIVEGKDYSNWFTTKKTKQECSIQSLVIIPIIKRGGMNDCLVLIGCEKEELPVEEQSLFLLIGQELSDIATRITLEREIKKKNLSLIKEVRKTMENERKLRMQKNELNEFVSFISHDIINALTVVEGYLNLYLNTNDQELMQVVQERIKLMYNLIEKSISIVEIGMKLKVEKNISFDEMVEKLALVVIPKYIHFTKDELGFYSCDETKMGQVFTNLFDNAIKHGKPKNIWVKMDDNEDKKIIRIGNDGVKIESKNLKKMFKKSFSTGAGLGHGLTLIKKIVESHGWEITVFSNDESTEFILTIPKEIS